MVPKSHTYFLIDTYCTISPIRIDARDLFSFSLVFYIALALAACGTGGYLVTKDQLDKLSRGRSTKENVKRTLGNPKSIVSADASDMQAETWIYTYAKDSSDPQAGVPPVGMTSVPISRNRRRSPEIHIMFDENGVVTSLQERGLR